MSEVLFKQVNYNLGALMEFVDLGEIGLPDIQRPFVWTNTKVRDLFDSIYNGYPVGYLLFWQSGVEDSNPKAIGTDRKQKAPKLLIVDGQQRLTALYAVIKGVPVVREDYSTEKISIAFNPLQRKFEVVDAAARQNPEFIPDISVVWTTANLFQLTGEFIDRLQASRELNNDEISVIQKAIMDLQNIRTFPFTALELSSSIDEEQVAEVFVRINSTGKPLNQADFILTLMSVFWDEGRAELEQFSRAARTPSSSAASPFNYFIEPYPEDLLRVAVGYGFRRARLHYVYLILRGKDLESEEFSEERRIEQFGRLRDAQSDVLKLVNWHDFMNVLKAAGFRSKQMVTSKNNLLNAYILYLIGREEFRVEPFTLKNLIARWFFMSNISRRYTSSPETRLEADLAQLRNIDSDHAFVATLERIIRDNLTEDFWTIALPNELATQSARSPTLFAYYAALNLLNAPALFSTNKVADLLDPATKSSKSAMERHHLFPRKYLESIGIKSTRDINQIANYALVEWGDNVRISDESPAVYFPKYANRFSPDDLDKMQYWHALPNGWQHMEYSEFLEARRDLMARVIRDGFATLHGQFGAENVVSGVPFGEQRSQRRFPE